MDTTQVTFNIGVDTGGTFTDAFVADDAGGNWTAKVPTTPHDLTVCFSDAIQACAEAVGLARHDLLRRTAVIRFSSTIATNTALTRSGPKLGLLVTAAGREALYGLAGTAAGETLAEFIEPDMITGIAEELSPDGEVLVSPAPDEVITAVRDLLERGARLLVVCLRHSAVNPVHEAAVGRIINASYPRHYLGAVPTLLSTDVSVIADDADRMAAAVVNGYLHRRLATSLYKAEDDLRAAGLARPLLIVTADGSVARVAKTRALDTYQSGPAAGVHGAALLVRTYRLGSALTADVGGTSTDFGLVVAGQPVRRQRVDVGGLDIAQSSVELHSIALGGGSVVAVRDGAISIGPDSAGAAPGPACFGLGGSDPTPTDAWLVLGYLDPANYLGGRRRLYPDLAAEALLRAVGVPLDLSAEDAALAVAEATVRAAADGVAQMLARPAVQAGLGRGSPAGLALISYGGGGGCLLPAVAARAGLQPVRRDERGHRGSGRTARRWRRRASRRDRHHPLLHHAGHEPADRAHRPAPRPAGHRGVRGHHADRPRNPVGGRHPGQAPAQHRPHQQAGAADRQGPDRRRQGAGRLHRYHRAPAAQGQPDRQDPLPGGPGRSRLRGVTAVELSQPGPRAADP